MMNFKTTQLTRSSRWEYAFSLLGSNVPDGYGGQSMVAEKERDGLQTIVASREEELGESEEGKDALQAAEQAAKTKESPAPDVKTEGPSPEPKPEPAPERKSAVSRMARTSRRR